ncbi:MAG: aldo/keto reductase, partial [Flavobacterium sp.]|nr:aldo/keto reductase [Flavobacterium sp.]
FGFTLAQMALAFVSQQKFVSATIIGATNLEQLKQNIAAFTTVLSNDILKEINLIHELYPNPAP